MKRVSQMQDIMIKTYLNDERGFLDGLGDGLRSVTLDTLPVSFWSHLPARLCSFFCFSCSARATFSSTLASSRLVNENLDDFSTASNTSARVKNLASSNSLSRSSLIVSLLEATLPRAPIMRFAANVTKSDQKEDALVYLRKGHGWLEWYVT